MSKAQSTYSWLWSEEDFDLAFSESNFGIAEQLWNNGIFTESQAYAFVFQARFVRWEYTDCPHCMKVGYHWMLKKETDWKCKNCFKKFSYSTSTKISNSKLPIHVWWRFCYLVGDLKISSSYVIANDLKVTQKTAWWMLNKLRAPKGNIIIYNNRFHVAHKLLFIDQTQPSCRDLK